MLKKSLLLLFACLLVSSSLTAQNAALLHPYNLDFEKSTLYTMPEGWTLPARSVKLSYQSLATDEQPFKGNYCLGLFAPENAGADQLGTVYQSLNATAYRGKTVRFRAAVRLEKHADDASASLWLKTIVDENDSGTLITNPGTDSVTDKWKYFEIICKVDQSSGFINFGLMIKGYCDAWIDDVTFEVLDSADVSKFKKPAPLSKQGLENIAVFARLYGLIRYFYPSFESLKLDWEQFALAGAEVFEKIGNKKDLLKTLNNFFLPVAPGIEILNSTDKPKKNLLASPPPKALKTVALAYKYEGSRDVMNTDLIPFNVFEPTRPSEGSVYQLIKASPYEGKRIRLSCMARIESTYPRGQGQLIIQQEKKFQKYAKREFLPNLTITENTWKKYTIEMDVVPGYEFIVLQLALVGEGRAYFDDIELTVVGADSVNICKNPGFEQERSEQLVYGWTPNPNSEKEHYRYRIVKTNPYKGNQCLSVESDTASCIYVPSIAEIMTTALGQNLNVRMPQLLFVDSTQTLPYPEKTYKIPYPENIVNTPDMRDRTSRLAIVVIAWNIMKNFSVSNTDIKTWDNALLTALEKAATDSTEGDFLNTLNYLTTFLDDPQSRAWSTVHSPDYALPFLIKWVDNKLLISEVAGKDTLRLEPGCEIVAIDGQKAEDYLSEAAKVISGRSDEWKKLRAIAALRAGDMGTQVNLKLKHTDGKTETDDFPRNMLISDLIDLRPPRISAFEPGDTVAGKYPGGLYYVDLTRVSEKELEASAKDIAVADGVVFDLRGYANVPASVLGYLLKDTVETFEWTLPVFASPLKSKISYRTEIKKIAPKKLQFKRNAVFICDEKTQGFSEVLLNIVRKFNLGTIVGSPTQGSPGASTPILLPGNFGFSLPEVQVRDIKTKKFIDYPIEPSVKSRQTGNGIINMKDVVLMKAFDVLTGKD